MSEHEHHSAAAIILPALIGAEIAYGASVRQQETGVSYGRAVATEAGGGLLYATVLLLGFFGLCGLVLAPVTGGVMLAIAFVMFLAIKAHEDGKRKAPAAAAIDEPATVPHACACGAAPAKPLTYTQLRDRDRQIH